MPGVLISSADTELKLRLKKALSASFCVIEAPCLEGALETAIEKRPEACVIDLKNPSADLDLIREMLALDPLFKAIVIAGDGAEENAIKAIGAGAFDYFTRPVSAEEVLKSLKNSIIPHNLHESESGRDMDAEDSGMLGTSAAMKEIRSLIRKVSAVDVPVLILGESGTGKEVAANCIHRQSTRKAGPFTIINCAAIPESLLEAELFGYEKGAFTGAGPGRKGKLEYAEGGTLFFDEIAELSQKLQVKLLRFLQDHIIERVGGREEVRVDTRVISATNRDIKAMVKAGKFREDLYFRLGVISLVMPPLKEREDDIYTLALAFLRKYSKEFNRDIRGYDKGAARALFSYNWPGNIRELENRIKRAVALCMEKDISADDLGFKNPSENVSAKGLSLAEARDAFKKKLVQEALLKNRGVISRASADLGISRQYLYKLIFKYGINFKGQE